MVWVILTRGPRPCFTSHSRLQLIERINVGEGESRGNGVLAAPVVAQDRHIFNQYVVRTKHRDGLKAHLDANKVGNVVYYPTPLHLQECFTHLGYGRGAFPESERAAEETRAIPIYPELTDEQLGRVVSFIIGFLGAVA